MSMTRAQADTVVERLLEAVQDIDDEIIELKLRRRDYAEELAALGVLVDEPT